MAEQLPARDHRIKACALVADRVIHLSDSPIGNIQHGGAETTRTGGTPQVEQRQASGKHWGA
ncbi:MAG: hypothetical protein ABI680_04965 [Chthoniobacteraceae bacterium]